MSDYKISYLLKTFQEEDFIYDANSVISHLYDKYDNPNTIKSYIFAIISYIKYNKNNYDKDDTKEAYKCYWDVINPPIFKNINLKTKCLIISD